MEWDLRELHHGDTETRSGHGVGEDGGAFPTVDYVERGRGTGALADARGSEDGARDVRRAELERWERRLARRERLVARAEKTLRRLAGWVLPAVAGLAFWTAYLIGLLRWLVATAQAYGG